MKNEGFAALLVVFVLGLASIFVASGLIVTGYNESVMSRTAGFGDKAFYEANSGMEDAIYKLNAGISGPTGFTTTMASGSAAVTISGTGKERQVTSVGTAGSYVSTVQATLENTSVKPGFLYALQANNNGIEIDHNTDIRSLTGDATVFSNGYIAGDNNATQGGTCKGSASAVFGNAYTVGAMEKTTGGSGLCVSKDAIASAYNYCYVFGKRRTAASGNCPGGSVVADPVPTPVPLPDMNIPGLKSFLTNQGTTYSGNCVVNGTSACSGGAAKTIGNVIITGTLTIPSNTTMTVTGPVWVQGAIIINSNVMINLTGPAGKIVVTDSTITVDSNVSSANVGVAYLLLISTYTVYPAPSPTPTPGVTSPFCSTPAITLSQNTSNILFFAPNGCISIESNATFVGSVVAEKIIVDSNSHVTYDPNLVNAVFNTTTAGGWQILRFSRK